MFSIAERPGEGDALLGVLVAPAFPPLGRFDLGSMPEFVRGCA